VKLSVANANTAFTRNYAPGQIIRCPVAHHDGNYFADPETLKRIEDEGQVVFRYADGHQSERFDQRHRRHRQRRAATCWDSCRIRRT